MSHSRAAIILAAGQGTRMKSKTVKVLHSVGGRPMLDWSVDLARKSGADRIVTVYGAHSPAVKTAAEALGKIEHALPDTHRQRLRSTPLFAAFLDETVRPEAFGPVRNAIANKRKLRVVYNSLQDEVSKRVIRPLALTCFGRVWLLSAWCELRNDFRHFRTDRIERLTVLAESYEDEPGKRYEDMRRAA